MFLGPRPCGAHVLWGPATKGVCLATPVGSTPTALTCQGTQCLPVPAESGCGGSLGHWARRTEPEQQGTAPQTGPMTRMYASDQTCLSKCQSISRVGTRVLVMAGTRMQPGANPKS